MGRRRSMMSMARLLDRQIAAARKETARQERIAYSEYLRLSQEDQRKYMIINPDGVLARKFKREEDQKKEEFRKEVNKYKTLSSEQKQIYKELYLNSQVSIVGDAESNLKPIRTIFKESPIGAKIVLLIFGLSGAYFISACSIVIIYRLFNWVRVTF
jgi:trehalose/maltose hydrolase-like predicted phosphorylase